MKRVGWIRRKCNQNLEGNASGRGAASISIKSSITGSVVEDDNMYSLHGAGVSVCTNELEGLAFASSRKFTWGSVPRECTLHCNGKLEYSHGPAPLQPQRFGIENQLCSIKG